MSSWPCSGVDCFLISSTTAWVAASMPRFMSIGLAPAARLRRPSVTIAWAMTVEVVVPSPATSLVFVAACLSIWAPMFWKWFSSSISLATVTPSWVTVGAPHFLSMATLRPRGPSVTLTALARASTPDFSCRRASASKMRSLAGMGSCPPSSDCYQLSAISYQPYALTALRLARSPRPFAGETCETQTIRLSSARVAPRMLATPVRLRERETQTIRLTSARVAPRMLATPVRL